MSAPVPFSRPATPGPQSLSIGWYGLGSMGFHMARNLAKYRGLLPGAPALLVYNRSVSKSQELQNLLGAGKVQIAKSPEQLVLECDIVFTSLATDAVVKTVYEQFAAALQKSPPTKNKIIVETSTIYPALAGELDMLLSSVPHTHFITCPVFGPPAAADHAQLICVLAGDYRSKKEIAHILVPAVGRKAMDLGGNVEKAPTFKLIGNSMILGTLEILAEAFTLSDKAGIGSGTAYELVKDMFPVPPWINYGDRMTNDNFDGSTGFAVDGGLKDAIHMGRLATELNSPMPAIDAARRNLLTARAQQTAKAQSENPTFDLLDWSSLIAGTRVGAGLEPFNSKDTNVVKE